jgi:hypothetical protein
LKGKFFIKHIVAISAQRSAISKNRNQILLSLAEAPRTRRRKRILGHGLPQIRWIQKEKTNLCSSVNICVPFLCAFAGSA